MPDSRGDPALDALLHPFTDGALAWPAGAALFIGARAGASLAAIAPRTLQCEQASKPDVDALRRAGFVANAPVGLRGAVAEGSGDAGDAAASAPSLVLLLPPRQRDAARAAIAQAFARVAPGGTVVTAAANDAGARTLESDFTAIAGPPAVRSKHKARVMWATAGAPGADAELAARWAALDAPRAILDGRYTSRPGVFAWDRIDPASALLADALPADLRGRAADLGAGWGFLSDALLQRCAGVTALDLYEADAASLALARGNLAAHRGRVALEFHWHDVAAGVPGRYDVIVSNPPFHGIDGRESPALGRAFIAAAAVALAPRGRLWLVANRHLPYEAALAQGFAQVRTVVQQGGFKVVEAVRGG